ncbi:PTS ascorbate-specific transporter subunit IIA [Treponema phagedenis]|uniref:Ascorbate-specific PTS system EIIA component n=1 Tax=Treponema phagedenis TaxID=162 RepID=A0A0B7GT00_TREPH|nr:PTS sugar transporter subunit IIA [Treponema phagedenis]EFW37514.1 phosphoenolpyruvate-dependent sugar phosphotransferase system, EIIA 2 [Treponema phagedenis F0421]NVP23355.1 PTS sugar transporter subunit IIA [Treponema phagedenis]QEJ95577.1 PTS ascorbate-specific transporter subunit IIA [Treponema phagedenis]QEJ98499.1 PTS ascorbate-specific transporter subunit IIA [Treponema phagedenis]QEK01429.1 PTS ascorbate-specific transporter subunit IIA [Treponema phagedenis]
MLKKFLLEKEAFKLQAEAGTWQEAIKLGTDILLQHDCIKPEYYDAVIQVAKEHGPYYVIAPGIAMPHARPETGAKTIGFALVTLKEPVKFNHEENDPVDIVLCICAPDAKALTEEGIMEVMNLFDGDENIQALREAKTKSDLENLLNSIEEL